jgi:hypothetical protein
VWLIGLQEAAGDLAASYLQEAATVNDRRRTGIDRSQVETATYVSASSSVVVDYFGETAWNRVSAPACQTVREILSSQAPDPAVLRRIGWELAPFSCPDCSQNCCRADWRNYAQPGDGFPGDTMGRCPRGH